MKSPAHYSLSLQLPLAAGGAALALGLCLLWLAATASGHLLREQEARYGAALAEQLAANLREPLQSGDLLAARASLQRFMESSMASSILVRDVEGMAIGSAGTPLPGGAPSYKAPISLGDDIAGDVLLQVDRSALGESRWRFLFSLLALTLALSLAVFLGMRVLATRLALRLMAMESELVLPGTERSAAGSELERLEHCVALLPLDMLRGHAPVPRAATAFRDSIVLFVHLASLARYVDTLSESNLHRYTRRLQQLVQAAAHCYGGELTVSRPFGLLLRFTPQDDGGSAVLRAASCARLVAQLALGLRGRTKLSIDLALALGHCEEETDEVEDIYPRLHQQGVIDELHGACLARNTCPVLLVEEALAGDDDLAEVAVYAGAEGSREEDDEARAFRELERLGEEQEKLIEHQARLIIERIAPRRD